ncbi:MAG: hypothetical protein D6797_01270 [Bdellovibrio sp.]|nr:MAG: hypothetical protein D6797_01270 [Bdellovibrio sp.]
MTTEVVLLLAIYAGIFLQVFVSVGSTFQEATPKLGARLELHLETGGGFVEKDGSKTRWNKAP